MKLDFPKDAKVSDEPIVLMTHDDVTIVFNLDFVNKLLQKNNSVGERRLADLDLNQLFVQINGYWASLPSAVQSQIFKIYCESNDILARSRSGNIDEDISCELVLSELSDRAALLYEHHSIDAIRRWMDMYSDIVLPVATAFDTDPDSGYTAEKTYTRNDYIDLVALAIALRAILPIWSEFISIFQNQMGAVWKEYFAFQMLNRSQIYHSRPMERLHAYIQALTKGDKNKYAGSIFGGISSEDFPIWNMANVVVRKIAIGDVRGVDPTTVLVKNVWRHVTNKLSSTDASFVGVIKEKNVESQSGNEESNVSKLEGYKARLEISAGDEVFMETCLDRYQNYIEYNDPTYLVTPVQDRAAIRQQLYQRFNEILPVLENRFNSRPVEPCQLRIMQYAMKNYINPEAVNMVCLPVVVAKLWVAGFYDLAILVCASPKETNDNTLFADIESRKRISKENQEALDKLFPYIRKTNSKKSAQNQKNMAITGIERLQNELSKFTWVPNIPKSWLEEAGMGSAVLHYAVPQDIKNKLAIFNLAVTERKF